ncbi:MAG: hypothetical protein O2782_06860 [bacterium]|nr:hypothetical protein [bacterium]
MDSWIFLHIPIEYWQQRWIDNYKAIFDAWEDGGVRGLAVGRLRFRQEDGAFVRAFQPEPKVYEACGVTPPAPEPRHPDREAKLQEILDDAAGRGWPVMIFDTPGGGGGLPLDQDPYGEARFRAAAQDVMRAFPQAQGVIMDGPGEQHYELAWHHGGEILQMRADERDRFAALGYDLDRLQRGIDHLRTSFRQLTPARVRYHAEGGLLAGLNLFDINEDALYWLRARQQTALGSMQMLRRAVDTLDRKTTLGGIPRITSWSSLTGQNYQRMAPLFDYIFPKHYYWHRGFDGMYGTVQRWVQKFGQWNPTLLEADCFRLVENLFGLRLPGVESLLDMERGFPAAFFDELVQSETARALAAIGDADKTIFWVSASAREPHAGDAMTGRDLQGILSATQAAGGKRFLFHPEPAMNAPAWHVISRMCGNPWNEATSSYWPEDTWSESVEGYGAHFRTAQKRG